MAENALLPIADKLGKLIPRLGTNHDGEIVATAHAIGRMLQGAGLDWHALAAAISAEPKPWVVYVDRAPAPTPNREPESWRDLARWCRDTDGGRLKPHERTFVTDLAARLICGGEPTERQAVWLRALYAKLRRASS